MFPDTLSPARITRYRIGIDRHKTQLPNQCEYVPAMQRRMIHGVRLQVPDRDRPVLPVQRAGQFGVRRLAQAEY